MPWWLAMILVFWLLPTVVVTLWVLIELLAADLKGDR